MSWGWWGGPNGPWSCDCNGAPTTPVACPYPDPGIANSLTSLLGLDYRFQPFRLANQPGLLVNQINSSGGGNIAFSLSPAVPFTTYSWGFNSPITGIVAALGAQGTMMRLTPSVAGFIATAADGTFTIAPAPAATVPDPLNIGTINVGNETAGNLTVTATTTLSGVPVGTITTTIGLNSSNQVVSGVGAHTSLAMYFENASRTTPTSPNGVTTANQPLVIGNELFDPDNIAHVQDSQTIIIDTAGTYEIGWGGYWPSGSQGGAPTATTPGIWLAIGSIGNVVSWGNTHLGQTNTNTGQETTGTHMAPIAASTKIYLIAGVGRTANGVNGVGLYLRRTGP